MIPIHPALLYVSATQIGSRACCPLYQHGRTFRGDKMGQIPQKLFVLPALVRGRSVIYVNVGILDGVVDIRENGRRRRKVNKRATTLAAVCICDGRQ